MTGKGKTALVFSTALPAIALAVFSAFSPQAAFACGSTQCTYASQCYDVGACVTAACTSGQSQKCESAGTWASCNVC
jgi:hypothetical protein